MDIGEIVTSSFYYAKDGLIGHWRRWFILIIGTFIFPILYGYTIRVMQGNGTAPEVEGYLSLFFDGLKLVLIQIIYAVPALILTIATAASALSFDGPGVFVILDDCDGIQGEIKRGGADQLQHIFVRTMAKRLTSWATYPVLDSKI